MAALGIDSGISKSEVLAHVPKTHTDMVAAVFRTIFARPDTATVGATWNEVRDQLAGRFPKIGTLMDAAKADVLAFTAFPRSQWPKIVTVRFGPNRRSRTGTRAHRHG
jgi:transposase-like protein